MTWARIPNFNIHLIQDYKWRTPFGTNTAAYNAGLAY
jgi:hypothetical protein